MIKSVKYLYFFSVQFISNIVFIKFLSMSFYPFMNLPNCFIWQNRIWKKTSSSVPPIQPDVLYYVDVSINLSKQGDIFRKYFIDTFSFFNAMWLNFIGSTFR